MPERYHGFLIPRGAKPAKELDRFMKLRAGLLEHPEYTDWRDTPSCDHCRCRGISCSDCLLWLDELVTWRGIARFHAYEQWLREDGVLPEDYKPFAIVTGPHGFRIGSNLLNSRYLAEQIRSWDTGAPVYCTGVECAPGGCDKCIFCCNHGDRRLKLEAFYQYASALGLSLRDRCAEGAECSGDDTATVSETEESVAPVANLQPTQPVPENAPNLTSWTKALAKYNRGFTCWCDALDKTVQCPDCGCAGCLCSTANPVAEEAFGKWAQENGWDVTRSSVLDTYAEPEIVPPKREVDFSMSTDSFDDPYRLPELKPWNLVHFDIPLEFGDGRIKTQWGIVFGRCSDEPGDYWVITLAVGSAVGAATQGNNGVLGYTYEVRTTGADYCTGHSVHIRHIDAVVGLEYADHAMHFINGTTLATFAGVSDDHAVLASAPNCWFRAEN